jgi:hypothetical protein
MYRNLVLIGCLLCAALLIGCSKTETTTNTASDNSNKAAASTPAPPTTGTTASTGDKIGVPECDDFIAKYEACVSSKVPEIARSSFEAGVKTWRSEWKRMAENPQTKGSLVAACKQAREQQEAALKSYGCKW